MGKTWKGLAIATMLVGASGCHLWRHAAPAEATVVATAPGTAAAATGTTPAPATETGDAAPTERPEYPASYAGRLPCADCGGIDVRLNLFGDGVYFLREVYLGRTDGESAEMDVGRWSRVGEPATLQLHGGREAALQFALQQDGSLRALDAQGQPIDSALNYRLGRDAEFQALYPQLPLRGQLLVEGDRARFLDCLTGRDLEVAADADAPAMRAAYQAAGLPAGARILATVQGQWQRRNGIEQLQIQKFRKLWPGESCGPQYADAELEGTWWKLSRLGDTDVFADAAPQPASLTLGKDSQRASGSSGCNRYTMAYAREGETITFSPGVLTRMACPAAAMAQESAFMAMLGKATRAQVAGQTLSLLDDGGTVLARFEALPFPDE